LDKLSVNDDILTWDDTYAIALALKRKFPEINLEEVSLRMIYAWTNALPEFRDDPELANDMILSSIYQEWYEEVSRV
jgi:FeS assembly protein IscX